MKILWRKWKNHEGPLIRGSCPYAPMAPWGPWTRILGVVAACEGKHDTVVMYDGTGVTWGFGQWTFTSGRLQRLLQSFKSVSYVGFEDDQGDHEDDLLSNLFDELGVNCVLGDFDLRIKEGRLRYLSQTISGASASYALNPRTEKKLINDICLGKKKYPKATALQKKHAKSLARAFSQWGREIDVQQAQIQFAKQELKRAVHVERKALGGISIRNLLDEGVGLSGDEYWDSPVPALFFNLWQNSPKGAYRFFINANKEAKRKGVINWPDYLDLLWSRLNRSAYANWGWNSRRYKEGKGTPRIKRIRPAIKAYYDIDLPYEKP